MDIHTKHSMNGELIVFLHDEEQKSDFKVSRICRYKSFRVNPAAFEDEQLEIIKEAFDYE